EAEEHALLLHQIHDEHRLVHVIAEHADDRGRRGRLALAVGARGDALGGEEALEPLDRAESKDPRLRRAEDPRLWRGLREGSVLGHAGAAEYRFVPLHVKIARFFGAS